MTDLRIVSEPRGDAEDATFVRDGLALFNVAVTGDSYYSPLAIFLKDERGAVVPGAAVTVTNPDGQSMMGTGVMSGENRTIEAAKAAAAPSFRICSSISALTFSTTSSMRAGWMRPSATRICSERRAISRRYGS